MVPCISTNNLRLQLPWSLKPGVTQEDVLWESYFNSNPSDSRILQCEDTALAQAVMSTPPRPLPTALNNHENLSRPATPGDPADKTTTPGDFQYSNAAADGSVSFGHSLHDLLTNCPASSSGLDAWQGEDFLHSSSSDLGGLLHFQESSGMLPIRSTSIN